MKRIILAAIGAAVAAGLTACGGNAAAPGGPGAASATHKSVVRVPASCGEQYKAWAHGQGKGLVTTVTAVSSAATVGDAHVLTVALKKARPAVALAARHPMPGCADPRGYWGVLLMHVNAAAAKGTSALSRHAALNGVPNIAHRLTTELKQTTPMNLAGTPVAEDLQTTFDTARFGCAEETGTVIAEEGAKARVGSDSACLPESGVSLIQDRGQSERHIKQAV